MLSSCYSFVSPANNVLRMMEKLKQYRNAPHGFSSHHSRALATALSSLYAAEPVAGEEDDKLMQIYFMETDVIAYAKPGTMLSQVAEDAGVSVSYGCGSGQCGLCEMEVRKYGCRRELVGNMKDGNEATKSASGVVVRSCITPIPHATDFKLWEVSEFVDPVWGDSSIL